MTKSSLSQRPFRIYIKERDRELKAFFETVSPSKAKKHQDFRKQETPKNDSEMLFEFPLNKNLLLSTNKKSKYKIWCPQVARAKQMSYIISLHGSVYTSGDPKVAQLDLARPRLRTVSICNANDWKVKFSISKTYPQFSHCLNNRKEAIVLRTRELDTTTQDVLKKWTCAFLCAQSPLWWWQKSEWQTSSFLFLFFWRVFFQNFVAEAPAQVFLQNESGATEVSLLSLSWHATAFLLFDKHTPSKNCTTQAQWEHS